MIIDNVYRLGLWIQRFRDSRNILPTVKGGKGDVLYGLNLVQRTLVENNIGSQSKVEIPEWTKMLELKYKDDVAIEKEDARKLVVDSAGWNKEIHADLIKKYVMEISESVLSPKELIKLANGEPSEFIKEELYAKFTDIEKSDFADAAKCLLLGSATPSVMVMFRGAEACIREFYIKKIGSDPGKKSWRWFTRELKREAQSLEIDKTFIEYLDYIGKEKRNFAQHPNKVYSVREAAAVLMQVISLVEDVYAYINS